MPISMISSSIGSHNLPHSNHLALPQVVIELSDGFAEMFGTEIIRGIPYTFLPGAKNAIFTYHGCTISVSNYFIPSASLTHSQSSCYVSKETPMMFYLNVHGYLEKMRQAATETRDEATENRLGPVVLLCGPADVGKSTVCKILLNYAVGCGRTPIYVDLDVNQGNIGVPGTIGCNVIERPFDLETGFSDLAPLLLHYGDVSLESNVNLMQLLIGRMAEVVAKRMEKDPLVRHSGVIINTGSQVQGDVYRLLLHAARKFKVDIILAIDQEKLYNELARDLPNCVRVLFTPKSGGVLIKSPEQRAESRDGRIDEYFYGSSLRGNGQLYPHSFDIVFKALRIYQIGAPEVPTSCLPLGMKKTDHQTQLVEVSPSLGIQNHLLSLMSTSELDEVLCSPVKGILCVTDVDMSRQAITVISPQPRDRLPEHPIFLLSNIQFLDNH